MDRCYATLRFGLPRGDFFFEKDELKSIGWFQKVARKDDSDPEPIDDEIIWQ